MLCVLIIKNTHINNLNKIGNTPLFLNRDRYRVSYMHRANSTRDRVYLNCSRLADRSCEDPAQFLTSGRDTEK